MNLNKILKVRFKRFSYEWTDIVLAAVFLVVMLIIDFVGLAFLGDISSTTSTGKVVLDWLVALNGILLGVYSMTASIRLFGNEVDQNVVKMDQHAGTNVRDIFLSRLIEIISFITIILAANIVVNMIIIGVAGKFDSYSWYRFYCISLGWYALVAVVITGLTIFLVSFIKGAYVGIVSTIVLLLTTFFAFLGGAISMDSIQKYADDNWNDRVSNLFFDKAVNEMNSSEFDISNNGDFSYEKIKKFISDANVKRTVTDNGKKGTAGAPSLITFGEKGIKSVSKSANTQLKITYNADFLDSNSAVANFYKYWDKYFDEHSKEFKSVSFGDNSWFMTSDSQPIDSNRELFSIINSSNSKYSGFTKAMQNLFNDKNAIELSSMGVEDLFTTPGMHSQDNSWIMDLAKQNNVLPAKIMFFKNSFNAIYLVSNYMNDRIKADSVKNSLTYNYPNYGKRATQALAYNPLVQFSSMFGGVNYRNISLSDQANNNLRQFSSLTMISENHGPKNESWDGITFRRSAYVELAYVGYTVFNGILIAISYPIFKKKNQR